MLYIITVGVAYSFGAGSRYQPISLDDTKCTGVESSLLQCQGNKQHNCDHREDAGVICNRRSGTSRLILLSACAKNQTHVVSRLRARRYLGRQPFCSATELSKLLVKMSSSSEF